MCHFLEHCVSCPDWQDCPDFQEAFDEYYDEVQREQEEPRIAVAIPRGLITVILCETPVGDDNDPTTRGVFYLPAVAPPADHHSPSATA